MSNYESSFHVIDLKLDVEPSLVHCRRHRRSARIAQRHSSGMQCCSACAVERSDGYLCTGGRLDLPWTYTRVRKRPGAFEIHSTLVLVIICVFNVLQTDDDNQSSNS